MRTKITALSRVRVIPESLSHSVEIILSALQLQTRGLSALTSCHPRLPLYSCQRLILLCQISFEFNRTGWRRLTCLQAGLNGIIWSLEPSCLASSPVFFSLEMQSPSFHVKHWRRFKYRYNALLHKMDPDTARMLGFGFKPSDRIFEIDEKSRLGILRSAYPQFSGESCKGALHPLHKAGTLSVSSIASTRRRRRGMRASSTGDTLRPRLSSA